MSKAAKPFSNDEAPLTKHTDLPQTLRSKTLPRSIAALALFAAAPAHALIISHTVDVTAHNESHRLELISCAGGTTLGAYDGVTDFGGSSGNVSH